MPADAKATDAEDTEAEASLQTNDSELDAQERRRDQMLQDGASALTAFTAGHLG